MKKRIMAAWKVLRGEWVAHAPVKPRDGFKFYEPQYTTASTTSATFSWTQPTFEPRKAGRRAVWKHADALRRLAR